MLASNQPINSPSRVMGQNISAPRLEYPLNFRQPFVGADVDPDACETLAAHLLVGHGTPQQGRERTHRLTASNKAGCSTEMPL